MNKKILVTGANGYIGSGVTDKLLDYGFDVSATDIQIDKKNKNITYYETDLFKHEDPFDYFGQPEIVLHLAWRNGFVHNSETHLADLPNHYTFLDKMAKSGVKRMVVLGSMHEVGFFEGRVTENTPCHPLSLYGIAKNALRDAVDLSCKQNDVLFQWIRGFYLVGNSEKGSSIFAKIVKADKEGKEAFPFTTGVNQYDFLDYDDFCNQIVEVCRNDKVTGIINACSGKPESLASRVERFIKDNNYSIRLQYGTFPDRPYDSLAIWGDSSKINLIMEQNRNI